MSEVVERGIVEFFKSDKKFGFVRVLDAEGDPTNTVLFFHYGNGNFLREGDDGPDFRYETGSKTDCGVMDIKAPEKGDMLVLVRGRNAKGEMVAKWGYAWQYDSIVERIAGRPIYRVVKSGAYYGKSKRHVVWRGRDIMELSAKYPKREHSGRVSDHLQDGTVEDGWSYHIQLRKNGSWTSCEDPRVFFCCIPPHILRKHGSTMDPEHCAHR